MAPLFHITGLGGHIAASLLIAAPLVLFHQFSPALAIETIRSERPTFTVGSITVFIALMNAPNAEPYALASLGKIWSGGVPIPPSTVTAFSAVFGQYIHNIYGPTETTSPTPGVPYRADARSTTPWARSRWRADLQRGRADRRRRRHRPTARRGRGIVTSGPQIVAGYWNKPEETARAIPGGALHTGDVGYMDAAGWFYIVDRKKDQINAAATRCGRARWRMCSTSTSRCARRRWSGWPG